MKNLKIGRKFLLTFGIIIILLAITAAVGLMSLNTVSASFKAFYERPYVVTNKTMEMRKNIQSAAKNVGYASMSEDVEQTQKYIDACISDLDTMKEDVAFLYENFRGDQSMIDDFNATMVESAQYRERVLEHAQNMENQAAAEVFFNQYQPYLLKANELLEQINASSMENAKVLYDESDTQKDIAFIWLIGSSVAALVLTVVLALYLTRSLTRPIKEIQNTMEKITDGDLSGTLVYEAKDELGALSESMRGLMQNQQTIIADIASLLGEMAQGNFRIKTGCEEKYVGEYQGILKAMRGINKNLSDTLSQINEASDQVAMGSGQVSDGAQALSQGATEQASSIEELSATITEIAGQIKVNAENAKDANSLTQKAGEALDGGSKQMEEMVKAMEGISSTSSEIGKIIKTIDDIAFQTNILALNAAVEAARAGEAGKGFAVVADEVRNLAQKSAEAAQNTTALIESAITAVDNGTKIAAETADSITEVVSDAAQVADVIEKIAIASEQQADAIAQVTQGVDQISSVVQTNSATAEESAATSEELSGQAQTLKNLVGRFQLRQ